MLLVSKFQELSPEHDAAVDEILLREFPLYKGRGWFDQKATQREKDAAQARFDEILALPKDQVIGQLREEAARKEDEQRNAYYAKCSTPINWSHWGNLPLMPLVSACKMMTGFNPEHPEHAIDEADKWRDSSVRPRWANLYHHAISAEKANQLTITRDHARSWEEVLLREFVNFIHQKEQSDLECPWSVPQQLERLLENKDTSEQSASRAKRKAPDAFIAALLRLVVEISKRAATAGEEFDVEKMPGVKADFLELAERHDPDLKKALRTFDDYLAGLVKFSNGAKPSSFYRGLFPEIFQNK